MNLIRKSRKPSALVIPAKAGIQFRASDLDPGYCPLPQPLSRKRARGASRGYAVSKAGPDANVSGEAA
ncbi:MAG: hypothetical protein JWL63_2106 [Rhodocyclales bacterium]|nr:hypothetical protein [Rhodocyclales bacterium]